MKYNQWISQPISRHMVESSLRIRKTGALTVRPEEQGSLVRIEVSNALFASPPDVKFVTAMLANFGPEKTQVMLHEMFVLGEFFANGVHILDADQRTLDAMDAMDLPVTAEEYHQPFPAIGIQTPADFFIINWNQLARLFTIIRPCPPEVGSDVAYFSIPEGWTIEESMSRTGFYDDPDYEGPSDAAKRTLINLCLFATHNRLVGPENCQHRNRVAARLEKARKRGDEHLAGVNERELAMIPFRFTIDQRVPLFRTTSSTDKDAPTDSTGRLMPPHWRRGHWRRQRHGVGNSETKLIPIQAVLVNADLLLGDRSLSRVTYAGGGS